MPPDGSPHRGSGNLCAVSSFNEFQQTGGQQITQDGSGEIADERFDVDEI